MLDTIRNSLKEQLRKSPMVDDLIDLDDDETPIERKATLGDLLHLTRLADDAVDDTEIDLEELGSDLRNKVDAITEYLDYCDARSAAIKARAEMLTKKAKSFERSAERLREYVASCMHADLISRGDFLTEKPKLPGVNFEILLRYSETVEQIVDPDPALYLRMSGKYIRRSYQWDKRAVKKALKENDPEIARYAKLKKQPYIKINPKS